MSNAAYKEFLSTVETQIQAFPDNRLVSRVMAGRAEMHHYHTILCTLFHQTYNSPYSFARAGVNCEWRHETAKEYLIRHAEEELIHWRWVLDDLAATGYGGASPREELPHYTCQAYIALNDYVAEQVPVARLAMAAVLEGIGSTHGGAYGRQLVQALDLKANQASFFLSHAETDKVHTVELNELIGDLDLSAEEWRWMIHTANSAGRFYRAMYDHEGFA